MNRIEQIFCPVNGWDCPYFSCGECMMLQMEGIHPNKECDDFMAFEEYFKEDE